MLRMSSLLVNFLILFSIFVHNTQSLDNSVDEEATDVTRYVIEGKVFAPDSANGGLQVPPANWQANTHIQLNGGEFLGFIREDGTFVVHNVPSGSYVLEVINPDFLYESVRVEINSKGKYRARKVNYVQTSLVLQVPYPLKLKPVGKCRYFQVREQWRMTDFLFNPMILMMVLPLLLIMILPKMMSDPDTKKEMEQFSSLTKFEMPEMSEIMTSLFNTQQPQKKQVKAKKRQ